jgi:hypothetical protein
MDLVRLLYEGGRAYPRAYAPLLQLLQLRHQHLAAACAPPVLLLFSPQLLFKSVNSLRLRLIFCVHYPVINRAVVHFGCRGWEVEWGGGGRRRPGWWG